MGYLIAVLRALFSGVTTIFNKNYMSGTKDVKSNFDIRVLVVYPIATIFYFFMAKMDVPLNFITFLFAIVLSLISLGMDWSYMVGLNFATVTYLTVFSSTGSTVMLFLYELIFTDDVFSVCAILGVIIRLIAVAIPLFCMRSESTMSLKGFVFCILYFLFAGFSGILTRVYVDTPGVMSTASLCFWVNVIIMPIAIAKILLKSGKGNSPGMKALWKDAKMIHPKYYLLLVVTVVFGNTLSLVGYEVVRMIGGTASSVISGSLSMIEAVLISVWIYKEGVSRQSLFSAALSVVAVVLSVL